MSAAQSKHSQPKAACSEQTDGKLEKKKLLRVSNGGGVLDGHSLMGDGGECRLYADG